MLSCTMTIGGNDVSKWVMKIHCEQTIDCRKDPDKVDIQLSNTKLRWRGKFAPNDTIECVVLRTAYRNVNGGCKETRYPPIQLFKGDVQKASTDERIAKIEGSCYIGGMSGNLPKNVTYHKGTPIDFIVNDLLDQFEYKGGRAPVDTKVSVLPRKDLIYRAGTDFLGAFQTLADLTGSWYFADEYGIFYYVDPKILKYAKYLNGYLLNGDDTAALIGYANVVQVIGGTPYRPDQIGAEIPTHYPTHRAKEEDAKAFKDNGRIEAPPVYVPEANKETCEKMAKNLLAYFSQFEDHCKPIVVGICPAPGAYVTYSPRNGADILPTRCDDAPIPVVGNVTGVVVRRVVDYSTRGLITELEVSTQIKTAESPYGDLSGAGDDLEGDADKLDNMPNEVLQRLLDLISKLFPGSEGRETAKEAEKQWDAVGIKFDDVGAYRTDANGNIVRLSDEEAASYITINEAAALLGKDLT